MLKGFLKVSVLGFMVNGCSNFCPASSSNFGRFSGEVDREALEKDQRQLSEIFRKEVEDYGTQDEINRDLGLLNEIKGRCGRWRLPYGEWQLPLSGMDLKYKELEKLKDIENIRSIKKSVCAFLRQKREQYGERKDKYKKEIEKIYSNQGMSDTEEETFYENVVFLNQVRNGGLYKNEKRELFGEIDGLLEGVSFWRKS